MKMTPEGIRGLRAQCSLIQRKDFPVHYGVGEHKGVTRADIQSLCAALPEALDDLEEALLAFRDYKLAAETEAHYADELQKRLEETRRALRDICEVFDGAASTETSATTMYLIAAATLGEEARDAKD